MLPHGPPWMKAGLPSSVWTRFGAIASLSTTAIAPAAFRSAARTALHAEARPEARLAQTEDRLLADMVQRVAEPDRRRRFAFASRRRGDCGYENELAVALAAERANVVERDLRLVSAIGGNRLVG